MLYTKMFGAQFLACNRSITTLLVAGASGMGGGQSQRFGPQVKQGAGCFGKCSRTPEATHL
ncbi:hypothetical protein E2C01_098895 [Portunus trituberculatus]|uniref:Uncharacterized protein n=1 Tax=Portunus trituberculatus TaxID=210409 RepID=A0A5B7KDA4_PORTR|nr:hypothetical protein [Portunus trituberculatus]